MENKLNFNEQPWLTMLNNAATAFPLECCGFIMGHVENGTPVVTMIIDVSNAAGPDKYHHFLISSKNYMAAEKFAEQNKLTLLGIYHSHPNRAPLPSIYDIKYALPAFFYVILSVRNYEVTEIKCWQLDEHEQFRELMLDPLLIN